ncbi:hypothetical protein ACS0TY_020302 [Phlomoides rotata]
MGKRRTISKKKNGGFVKLKIVVKRLQKSLIMGKKLSPEINEIAVPEDVKEGHFAVVAVDDDELKRFVVPLTFLTQPSFLSLLEQAAEEYGFCKIRMNVLNVLRNNFEYLQITKTTYSIYNREYIDPQEMGSQSSNYGKEKIRD